MAEKQIERLVEAVKSNDQEELRAAAREYKKTVDKPIEVKKDEQINRIERDDILPIENETKGKTLARNLDVNDKKTSFETKSNSERASETMVDAAAARGWQNIKVSGSEDFKKQAWEAAAEKGMEVRGYEPTEAEKVKVLNKVLAKEFVDDPEKAVKQHPELKISHKALNVIIEKAKSDGLNKEQLDYVSQRVKQNIGYTIEQGRMNDIKSFEKEYER